MSCELKEPDVKTTFPGTTLFSTGKCMMPTGVYLPPKHLDTTNALNVVVWLHGWDVKNKEFLFNGDRAHVRDTVLKSTTDVVLIAPWLGHKYGVYDADGKLKEVKGSLRVDELGKEKWGENYLTEVLGGLARFQNPSSPPTLLIKYLVIACHSGGGEGMRNLVGTIGKHQPNECWGFDCLYGNNIVPDDATFWAKRTLGEVPGQRACPLSIFYGPSTIRQSVKLDLIARGKATPDGEKVDPPGRKIYGLNVSIGTDKSINVDDLMSQRPPEKSLPKDYKKLNFVQQMAVNLKANVAFPDDVHYFIAKTFFLSRLKD